MFRVPHNKPAITSVVEQNIPSKSIPSSAAGASTMPHSGNGDLLHIEGQLLWTRLTANIHLSNEFFMALPTLGRWRAKN